MQNTDSSALVWLRRDLRLEDNAALAAALQSGARLHCVFVLDRAILDALPRADRRVEFILARSPAWMPSCAHWPAMPAPA